MIAKANEKTKAKRTVRQELEHIRKSHGGTLKAEDVVEFARSPKTALHNKFTWDDSTAAHEYRLWQARQLIRVTVEKLPPLEEPVRQYVSLLRDRTQEGGGYRPLVTVMSDDELRAELLAEALAELKRFQAKYRELKELVPVFDAIEKVEKQPAFAKST